MISNHETKTPRLHSANTLKEAAAWLSARSIEQWNVPAVLGRMREWGALKGGRVSLMSDVLKVVVPGGCALIDPWGGERHVLSRPITMEVGGLYVDALLQGLHEHGAAYDVTVFSIGGGRRWRIDGSLTPDAVRLTPAQVDALECEFDWLLQSGRADSLVAAHDRERAGMDPIAADVRDSKLRRPGPAGWRGTPAWAHLVSLARNQPGCTGKQLYAAAKINANSTPNDSPFEVGTGANRGNLIIKETGRLLAEKTLLNAMADIRKEARGA